MCYTIIDTFPSVNCPSNISSLGKSITMKFFYSKHQLVSLNEGNQWLAQRMSIKGFLLFLFGYVFYSGLVSWTLHSGVAWTQFALNILATFGSIIIKIADSFQVSLVWQWGLNIVCWRWFAPKLTVTFCSYFKYLILNETPMPVDSVAARSIKFCNKVNKMLCF